IIADSMELAVLGHSFDAAVALSGCDKTIPAAVMALARLDVPSLVLYGGAIQPGRFQARDVTIPDGFQAAGACAPGPTAQGDLALRERRASPGAGARGGQFTANTRAAAITLLGMSPMGANDVPATDPEKAAAAFRCGELSMRLLEHDLRPSRIITRAALENA